MKVSSVELINVNGLPDTKLEGLDGPITIVMGDNGVGKSITQDLMKALAAGTMNIPEGRRIVPSDMDDPAIAKVEITDELGSIYYGKFSVKKTPAGNWSRSITITTEDGAKYADKKAILSLFGSPKVFSAEDYRYNSMSGAGKTKNAKLMGKLLDVDVSSFNEEIETLEEKRREINRYRIDTEKAVKNLNLDWNSIKDGGEEVDDTPIRKKIAEAEEHNNSVRNHEAEVQKLHGEVEQAERDMLALQRKMDDLKAYMALKKKDFAEKVSSPAGVSIDTEPLKAELEEAIAWNAGRSAAINLKPQLQKVDREKPIADSLNKEIKEKRDARQKAIADAANKKLPEKVSANVDDDGKVFLTTEMHGTYVDLATAPDSRIPFVEALINLKLMPEHKLSLITIRNASLMDRQSREFIYKKAEEVGASVWVEVVDFSGNTPQVQVQIKEAYHE